MSTSDLAELNVDEDLLLPWHTIREHQQVRPPVTIRRKPIHLFAAVCGVVALMTMAGLIPLGVLWLALP